MAYTGSVGFSPVDGISQSYDAKAKVTSEVSFEDALENVENAGNDYSATEGVQTYKKDENSNFKASELATSVNGNRKEALTAITAKEDSVDSEEVSDRIALLMQELIAGILQMLEEKLGMTAEELSAALEDSGMAEIDLLDAGSMTQFVVDVKADGNLNELLVDEDLHAAVSELTDKLESALDDISKELGKDFSDIKADFATADMAKSEIKSAEAENSSNDADMNNGAYNGAAMFDEIVDNIVNDVSLTADKELSTNIVNQIVEQIKLRVTENVTSMELYLTPETLGKINLQISSKNGVVTAQITTETTITKEAIESQLALLKENLNEQGLKIEAVEVTVAPHRFEARNEEHRDNGDEGQQQQRQQSQRRFIDVAGEEEQYDDAAAVSIARDIMMSNGNRMDIRA